MAYDLVTPSKQQSSSQALVHQHKAPHEPLDFREGLANAYDVVSAVSTVVCTELLSSVLLHPLVSHNAH